MCSLAIKLFIYNKILYCYNIWNIGAISHMKDIGNMHYIGNIGYIGDMLPMWIMWDIWIIRDMGNIRIIRIIRDHRSRDETEFRHNRISSYVTSLPPNFQLLLKITRHFFFFLSTGPKYTKIPL